MENIGLVIVAVVVIGFIVLINPKPPRRVQKNAPQKAAGYILPDGRIVHNGKVITFVEAKKRGLHLDFAEEKRADNGYKPRAWR